MDAATESVCPKGWTLPVTKQINSNRDVSNFSPILGGDYSNGSLDHNFDRGWWWGSEANSGPLRGFLGYNGTIFYTGGSTRRSVGAYIRCVSEEKTVTDLTYMQDMTPSIAN